MNKVKGVDLCNRTACQAELVSGAIYYNNSTEASYCPRCAYLINKYNPNLCVLDSSKVLNKGAHNQLVSNLEFELKAMHPADGLTSPRDIQLASDINRFASVITEVKHNKS